MVLFLYQCCYLALAPFILVIQLLRKDLRSRLTHFYGLFREENQGRFPTSKSEWFHAVSLGETLIHIRFIKMGLDSGRIKGAIFFTTTIDVALHTFQQAFRNHYHEKQIFAAFLPLDFYPIMVLFLKRVKPVRFFLSETDFWPTLLWLLRKKEIPCYAINVRVSKSLHYWYDQFPSLSKPLFNGFNKIFTQSKTDTNRLHDFTQFNLMTLGNAKFDLLEPKSLPESLQWLSKCSRQIICFGSFHRDEFSLIYEARKKLNNSAYLFLVAPRNLEHLPQLSKDIKANGWSLESIACEGAVADSCDFVIVDRMGLLASIYSISQLAVIGGSFNMVGGHNPLEPMLYRRPVIVGPRMRNYQDLVSECVENELIWQVSDGSELLDLLHQYHMNPKPFIEGSLKAFKYLKKNQGTLQQTWENIEPPEAK